MTSAAAKKTRTARRVEESAAPPEEKKDPFEEIDFGSFFQDYLDPGYRSSREMEDIERPSFENFLSRPSNLTDHLTWQLGAVPISPEVRQAAEVILGNLNEDGYLIASDEELLGIVPPAPIEADATLENTVVKEAAALGLGEIEEEEAGDPLLSDDLALSDDPSVSARPALSADRSPESSGSRETSEIATATAAALCPRRCYPDAPGCGTDSSPSAHLPAQLHPRRPSRSSRGRPAA